MRYPFPSCAELLARTHVVALPLHTRFRGITVREAALVEGPAGWSEFSPFVEYSDAEAAAWLAATIDFGWDDTPTLHRSSIPVNATVPAVPADAVAAVLARFDACRTVKVKVAETGQQLSDDVARVEAVRRAAPDARIRVDANGGWSVDESLQALTALQPFELEYVEQPCRTVAELAELRRRLAGTGVLIAADESVRRADDPLEVARAGAADSLVIKAQPLGGIRSALAVVAEAGLPVTVSSALDTSVGLSMGAHLAAALPDLPYDCGLGTAALLATDVTDSPLLPVGGHIPVRRVEVSADLLAAHAAAEPRAAWWRERIARTYPLLPGSLSSH